MSLGVLWAASVLVFIMVANSGDPLFDLKMNPLTPKASILYREHLLHLDKSIPERYWIWFTGVLHGDFGKTLHGVPVGPQLFTHMAVTMKMVIPALLLAIVIAISLGVYSATKRGRWQDKGVTFTSFLFLATPVFVVGLFLKFFVAIPIDQHFQKVILSTAGDSSPTATGGFFQRIPDMLSHMTLPTMTLVLAVFSSWVIYQRSTVLDTMDQDYVMLARSKGISKRRVLVRHILRNALIPVTTVIALDFAGLLGGAVITETVYSWNGLGLWFLNGVNALDINVVLAYLMFTATTVIIFNLLADLAYAVLDPRIRYS